MSKSFLLTNPRLDYAFNHSTPLNEHVEELIKSTFTHPDKEMASAKGVLYTCTAVIDMIQAKNVLDVGLYTGISALTWASAIPSDGKVISMDLEDEAYNNYLRDIIEASGFGHKIDVRIQPAIKTLQELIDAGESGKFDFAFLDANKIDYPNYYNLCLQLLRTGGVIAVDNAFWFERVLEKEKDPSTTGVDKLNKMASTNPDIRSVLLPIEDGLHLIVKKSPQLLVS